MSTPVRYARRRIPARTGVALAVSTVALVVVGLYLSYATALEAIQLTRLATPTPSEVSEDVIVRGASDRAGHRASFRVMLFSDEFRWELASSDRLERDGAPAFTAEMRRVLDRAREVIVVGASSEEVVPGLPFDTGRRIEERRAARRAEQIAMWVRQALSEPVPVRKLNVGHHRMTAGTVDTSDQRRVVIILVLEREEGTNVDQALRDAMARESTNAPVFEGLLTRYSLAKGETFTWVE